MEKKEFIQHVRVVSLENGAFARTDALPAGSAEVSSVSGT